MSTSAVLRALGPIDLASVRRDPLLRWMLLLPLVFALGFRWLAGLADGWLLGFGIEIVDYYPLVASFIVLLAPMLYGTVVGFLLLDQKDDRTLTALRVTPMGPRTYLVYRTWMPMIASVLVTPLVLVLSGFSTVSVWHQFLAGVAAAPLAPAFALFLAAFGKNKVQGFALMKASGVINWPPIIAWFVSPPWQLAFGLCPTYWPVKYYWSLEDGSSYAWLYLLASLLVLWLLVAVLARRWEAAEA